MKGDFSRLTFDPAKNFSRVLMQQGRVTLDADFNEQGTIFLHALRTLTRDLFGQSGGPADGGGFGLTLASTGTKLSQSLAISAGHYYVDGILCECSGVTYDTQADYAPASDDPFAEWLQSPTEGKFFWLYLDVWERHVSWVEDDSIREVALDGPDTCTRSKVTWQVKALEFETEPTCAGPLGGLVGLSDVSLAARLDPGAQLPDPCVLAPDAAYRGPENQLYRVEIHQGGSLANGDTPTFKWSRDNGSVAVPWLDTDGSDLTVTRARGFEAGIWVELLDDGDELEGVPGTLVKVVQVQGDRLSLDPSATPPARNAALHPRVRRWDQADSDAVTLVDGAVPVVETDGGTGGDVDWTLALEDGIEILFSPGGSYRTGDYWLIPARVATGSIEWPTTTDASGASVPALEPPTGIEHHYAPLGTASFVKDGNANATTANCRTCFGPLVATPCPAKRIVIPLSGATPTVATPKPAAATAPVRQASRPAAKRSAAKPAKGR
jgi:hypothetical protein